MTETQYVPSESANMCVLFLCSLFVCSWYPYSYKRFFYLLVGTRIISDTVSISTKLTHGL